MQSLVNEKMIEAGLEVLEEALSWPDYPYTNEQLVEAILRNAMKHYVHPLPAPPPIKTRNESDKDGMVYFIGDGDAIKIGKANDVKTRLSSLRTGTHKTLTCLGVTKGGRRKERELHRQFEQHHIAGEWFKDCPEIRAYIKDKCAPLANDNRRLGRPKKTLAA
jgi:hypothetical protein